jgi:SAM-dependent methyltransferase
MAERAGLRAAVTAVRQPNVLGLVRLLGDANAYLRIQFLSAALRSGLLYTLRTPATQDQLAQKLAVKRPELLDALLEMGVALKELSKRNGSYRISGRRSRALLDGESGDALAAIIEEITGYHASVYQLLPERLRGAPDGDYLSETGELIARSSRAFEPFVANFVRSIASTGRPMRMLEVGCGSGTYLRHAAEANPQLTGVGIDLQESVVQQARANLERWGLAGRFQVLAADVRQPPAALDGPFDLITLYNNIYYFTHEERPPLLRRVRSWLSPGGSFALVTLTRSSTPAAADLDLALRCTEGCTGLPSLDEVRALLVECGFASVRTVKLMPGEAFYGLVATPDTTTGG